MENEGGKIQQQQQIFLDTNHRAYFNFINSIRSDATRKVYEFIIKKYMQYYNIQNIDKLLAIKDSPSIIEDKIIDWLVALRDTITYGTRHTYFAALMTFYEINDVTLRKKKIARFLGQESTRKHKDRAYTIEEIRKLLEHADIRSKALVLLLVSSGIRIGAVTNLQIKHLKKIEEYNLYRITVYENTKDEYYTFCTPECAAVIDSYLSYRQQSGEKIEADAPLIRERFDIVEGLKECSAKRKAEFVQTRGIGEIISNLLLKSGITKTTSYIELEKTGTKYRGSERKSMKRAHGMRKFNLTSLVSAGVNPIVKEMLIGHKSSLGLDNNYYKPIEGQVLQEYLKAVDLLTINNEHRLKRKVVELTQKQDDIDLMKAEHRRKDLELREQMQQQQQQYQRMIEEFQERDRKEKEELRREITGTLEAIRALVTDGNDDSRAKNKAYHLQPEDTETKEALKKAEIRATEQLRKDTLAQYSRRRLRSISNRIQQQQHRRKNE